MECEATAKVDVVRVAWPVPSRLEVPSVDVPSLKVTVPVGVPPLEVTAAVKVTDWLNTEGLADELTVVVVAKEFCTVCTTLPLLAANTGSEAYVAVIVSLPTARAEVLKETWPLELSGACAKMVLPWAKVTWPVGVPVAGGTAATVAVKVTDWPLVDGLGVEVSVVEDAPV